MPINHLLSQQLRNSAQNISGPYPEEMFNYIMQSFRYQRRTLKCHSRIELPSPTPTSCFINLTNTVSIHLIGGNVNYVDLRSRHKFLAKMSPRENLHSTIYLDNSEVNPAAQTRSNKTKRSDLK